MSTPETLKMVPQLDYYIGRSLVEVKQDGPDWNWRLRFDGDALVTNTDRKRTAMPENLVGLVYLNVILTEDETRLNFGHYEPATQEPVIDQTVVFTPTEYTISDDLFEGGPHYPQRVPEEDVNAQEPPPDPLLPPDPSVDRVAEASVSAAEGGEGE
jgi:hypothetical protein